MSAGPLLNALKMERLERENQRLLTELSGKQPLIGNSGRMREVHRFVMKVSASDATVLITGESGTGKELVARAIHRTSARAQRPFVGDQLRGDPRDAARERALRPREGRLHRRRTRSKTGRFEQADGGTLFLDEIGELPPALQVEAAARAAGARVRARRRHRIDQGRRARRRGDEPRSRGGDRGAAASARISSTASTWSPSAMPPLRERREDIPLLADALPAQFTREHPHGGSRGSRRGALSCLMRLRLARQRARAGERDRARDRAGHHGTDPA